MHQSTRISKPRQVWPILRLEREIGHGITFDTDAYFLWIIYAIGAQFSTGSEQLSLVGHACTKAKCDD